MLKAHKKNRSIRIPDEKADEFKKLGYRITTMDGKTLYAPVDTDKENEDLKAENARLRQRIAELNLELEQLRGPSVESKNGKSKKAE